MTYADTSEPGHPHPSRPSPGIYTAFGKRVFDLLFVAAALPVAAPLIAVLALMARHDGGPGFFAHARVGRNGRVFRCWKIRTMAPDAEPALQRHLKDNPAAAAEWAHCRKLENDPRVTTLGRFLRRTSLDELPQVWNILRGDMSVVGPRPVTVGELAFYGTDRACYLAHRPGLTGMWQVHGRGDGCYDKRVRLDRSYHAGLTLRTDLGLLARTVTCVLTGTGR